MVDPDSYESRRKQKLNAREVMTVSHTTHELREVTESVTDHLPPIPVWVGLITEAKLGHIFTASGEAESDPLGDKADHHSIGCPAPIDLIYLPPSKSESNNDREVYRVAQGEPPIDKTAEENAREFDEEMARATRLT
jgi:hypothetical protein